jgi:hypothetical protein
MVHGALSTLKVPRKIYTHLFGSTSSLYSASQFIKATLLGNYYGMVTRVIKA